MPKLFGTSLWGILAATIAFYMVGFLWYSVLFVEPWMEMAGITEAASKAKMEKLGAMFFVYGLVITLVQVLGISYVLQLAGASRLKKCVEVALMIATFIALPVMAYNVLYETTIVRQLILDLGHIAVGYALAGAVLAAFRGKGAIGEGGA